MSKRTFLEQIYKVRHFYFFEAYNLSMKINGGAVMFASLCMAGLVGFVEFLKSAVFVVRIYSRRNSVSRTIK